MRLSPAVLENAFVRLEPLGEAHREPLRAICAADADFWPLYPYSLAGEHFAPRWERYMAEAAAGATMPFAVLRNGEVVGMTSFLGLDPANAALEIGATYYRADARGGAVNPAAKRLLLACAFEGGARRVQFKVDALNARSRAAVLKLGAMQEGILRQDRVIWTGRVRDTVHFSILAGEWPAVRERLDARLAAFTPQACPAAPGRSS